MAPASSDSKPRPEQHRVPLNCTKAFDSVYYCYSPFHQAREYYVRGELDDCRGRLKKFRMCMLSRFRAQQDSELIYEEEERREQAERPKPVWEMREEFLERVARADREEREKARAGKNTEENEAWWL